MTMNKQCSVLDSVLTTINVYVLSITRSRILMIIMVSYPATPLAFIESTFLDILSEIEKRPAGDPKIRLRRIVRDPIDLNPTIRVREVTYRWPGKTREEAWRFGTAMTSDPKISKRCGGSFCI